MTSDDHESNRLFRLVPLDAQRRRIESHPALEVTDLPGAIVVRLRQRIPVDAFTAEAKRLERIYGGDRQVLIVTDEVEFLQLEEEEGKQPKLHCPSCLADIWWYIWPLSAKRKEETFNAWCPHCVAALEIRTGQSKHDLMLLEYDPYKGED
jgi:hypothetical protein